MNTLPPRRLRNAAYAFALLLAGALTSLGCPGSGPAPRSVTVSVTPATASLAPQSTQALTAAVTNTTNSNVTWRVQEGAAGGAVTAAGLYTAPSSAGVYHVTAASVADSSKTATATMTVHLVVSVEPSTATLTLRQSQNLTAQVAGSSNAGVVWSLVEGAAGGAVDASGHYTAPNTPGTYHVTATSQADPTQSASATLVVQAGSASGIVQ